MFKGCVGHVVASAAQNSLLGVQVFYVCKKACCCFEKRLPRVWKNAVAGKVQGIDP